VVLSYHGSQRLTTANDGQACYGGSDLCVVRGGYDALLALPLEPNVREAIAQAAAYERAARHYPGLVLSRRNYDVAQGVDGRGSTRGGSGARAGRRSPPCRPSWTTRR
jgi:hypothetical protein